jgi:hypothetical protein
MPDDCIGKCRFWRRPIEACGKLRRALLGQGSAPRLTRSLAF